jgi:Domain of unknown function (DUF4258)
MPKLLVAAYLNRYFAKTAFITSRYNSGMPKPIEEICQKITEDQFEFSKHAVDQSILRGIRVQEIIEAITNGQVIESYPDDKYGPSCLVSGITQAKRNIHIQCSYPSRPLIKIITLYEPNLTQWQKNFTKRRNNDEQ